MKPNDQIVAEGGATTRQPVAKIFQIRAPGEYRIDVTWADHVKAPSGDNYLIKGIVEPGQTSIWFGPPGSGKSFLLLHCQYAVAQGREIFGRRVRRERTLYLALEGRGGIEKRLYALSKRFGVAPFFGYATQDFDVLRERRGGVLINFEHVEALARIITEHRIKFVVIDTLNLALGGGDENSNSDIGLFIGALNGVATRTGAHIALVAHSAKAGIDGGPRGGGAQRGNVDVVVAVSGEEIFTASSSPPAGKVKDGTPFKFRFRLKSEALVVDADGDPVTSCSVEEVRGSSAERKELTKVDKAWLGDLVAMFAEPGAAVVATPQGMSREVLTLTREQVRDGFRKKGRIGDGPHAKLTTADRSRLRDRLNSLRDSGKIGIAGDLIWPIDEREGE